MPRPRLLPLDGIRRTITLPRELDEALAVQAARRRIPVSLVLQEFVIRALAPPTDSSSMLSNPAIPPEDWDGADLSNRLLNLRMRQIDLAGRLQVHKSTLGSWINGAHPWPEGMLDLARRALSTWDPASGKFRWGSKVQR